MRVGEREVAERVKAFLEGGEAAAKDPVKVMAAVRAAKDAQAHKKAASL